MVKWCTLDGGIRTVLITDALPLTDGDAQEAAKKFSIPTRNPDIPEEIGSTICVIEPDVKPEDVKEAVERWWWPAITWGELGEGPELTISVTDYDQEDLEIKPREHAVIGSLSLHMKNFKMKTKKTTKSLESTEQVRAWKMTLKALQQVTYTYHHQQGGITLTMQSLILIVQLVMRYDMNHSSLWFELMEW